MAPRLHFDNIVDHVDHFLGSSASLRLAAFFNRAALPVPDRGEYLTSCDSGLLLFLQREACVLRFVSSRFPLAYGRTKPLGPDPEILQPFGTRPLTDDLAIEFVPGIRVGLSISQFMDILRRLSKRDIHSDDSPEYSYRNGGLLPDGTPVILDRGSVRDERSAARQNAADAPEQRRMFAPLIEGLYKVWPAHENLPTRPALHELWRAAAEMQERNKLTPGWLKAPRIKSYSVPVIGISNAYHQRRLSCSIL